MRLADAMDTLHDAFGSDVMQRANTLRQNRDVIHLLDVEQDAADTDAWRISGVVQGSVETPYDIEGAVTLYVERRIFFVEEMRCTCPVSDSCKHAAALLLEWMQHWQLDPPRAQLHPTDDPRVVSVAPIKILGESSAARAHVSDREKRLRDAASRSEVPDTPPPIKRALPISPPLAEWLEATFAQSQDALPASKQKKASGFVPSVIYVLTDARELHALRGRRRADGSEPELTGEYVSRAWLNSGRERPAYADANDVAVLTLMNTSDGQDGFELVVSLADVHGFQLLKLAHETGRLYVLPQSALNKALTKKAAIEWRLLTPPVALAEDSVVSLVWERVSGLRASGFRIGATMAGRAITLIPTQPAFALDVDQRRLHQVTTTMRSETLRVLTSLPPIGEEDELAWTFVRDALEALPEASLVPPLPVTVARVLPVPRALLEFVLIEYTFQSGWGKKSAVDTHVFPAARLSFEYDGVRYPVEPRGLQAAVEVEQVGNTVTATRTRNTRVESEWLKRLPAKLVGAATVEYHLAYAHGRDALGLRSLFALPGHDWSTDGAGVFADAQASGFQIEVDPSFPVSLADIPAPELELTPAQENGWFRIALGVTVGKERVDLAPALAKLIGAQRDAEAWLEAVRHAPTVLLSIAHKPAKSGALVLRLSGERIHAILAPIFDWFRGGEVSPISGLQAALAADLPPSAVRYLGRDDPRWIAMRTAIAEGATIVPTQPHPAFQASLRPYQIHGLSWLAHLRRLSMGGVLADDMGLGKTVQTLAFLQLRQHQQMLAAPSSPRKPSLIVAPTSVTVNWLAEARRFAPSLNVITHYGASRTLNADVIKRADLILTSYPILQRDEKKLGEIQWDVVVFDEAQTLKNAKAKTYQAAQSLSADMRLALTGTPMENHLGELWSLFNLLLPGLLGDLDSFNRIFRHPIEQHAATAQMQKLRARIRPFLLRRTREQVLADLPEKTEFTRWIELQPMQADLYESLRTAIHDDIRKVIAKKGLGQSTIHILDALLKLRQVCCDPRLVKLPSANNKFAEAGSAKLEWLMRHVPELIEEGRSILIFSQFTSMLALIAESLTAENIRFVTLTGETVDRETPIAQFQSGEVKVFLLSLKAGGVGLNLTAADTVIHYDPWWNPAVEAQATARAHRIGQTKPVFVTKLVSQGTLEERMMTLLARKRELAAALLDGEGSALTGMTLADVESLLAPISTLEEVRVVDGVSK
jgi:superfamily II DNA or RNA helicase